MEPAESMWDMRQVRIPPFLVGKSVVKWWLKCLFVETLSRMPIEAIVLGVIVKK